MTEVLDRSSLTAPAPERRIAPLDERAARRMIARQIEHLERDFAKLTASAWPRQGLDWGTPARGRRPHLPDLGELERARDALAHRVANLRAQLAAREQLEDANRALIGDMLRHPERHRWVRVSHADIGEPGCKHWHVVPRFGPIGLLTNWWRVKISSGCPLPGSQ